LIIKNFIRRADLETNYDYLQDYDSGTFMRSEWCWTVCVIWDIFVTYLWRL